jgi:hypothetical protein
MFSDCMCARYQASPKEAHLKIVKRILQYSSETTHFGLWYPKRILLSSWVFGFQFCRVKIGSKKH